MGSPGEFSEQFDSNSNLFLPPVSTTNQYSHFCCMLVRVSTGINVLCAEKSIHLLRATFRKVIIALFIGYRESPAHLMGI